MRFQRFLEIVEYYISICIEIIKIYGISIIAYVLTIIYSIFLIFVLSPRKLFIVKNKRRNLNLRSHYKKIRLNPKSIQTNRSSGKPTVPDNSAISVNNYCLDSREDSLRITADAVEDQISDNSKETNQENVDLRVWMLKSSKIKEKLTLSVIISNLQLFSSDKSKRLMKYFVCHLEHLSTLQTSSIIEGKLRETVRFREVFHFDDLPADFDIILRVYSLEVNTDKFKRLFKHFRKTRAQCFKYWGEKHIKINKMSHTFEDRNNVVVNFDINFRLIGFLNVSKCVDSCPAWMERWCVLTEKDLTFWSSPVDQELNNKPIDTLVLIKSMKIIETNLMSGLYRFSFILLIDNSSCNSVKYFLSARSEDEIYYWKKYLEYALEQLS